MLLCSDFTLLAQELIFIRGYNRPNGIIIQKPGYPWRADHSWELGRKLATSIASIDVRHLGKYHRDGVVREDWGDLPPFNEDLPASLRFGACDFTDMQSVPVGYVTGALGKPSIHSALATTEPPPRWFYRQLGPTSETRANNTTISSGFWFGHVGRTATGEIGTASNEDDYVTENEFTVFAGQSGVNAFSSQSRIAYAGEYRRGVFAHIDWTASVIYEGDSQVVRRNGVSSQLWAIIAFAENRMAFGVGLGPYMFLDHRRTDDVGRRSPAAIAPVASLTFSVKVSNNCIMRLVFDRVASDYNRDANIFMLGLGCCWPRQVRR